MHADGNGKKVDLCFFWGTGQCGIESRRNVYALPGFDWTAVGSGGRMGLSSYC